MDTTGIIFVVPPDSLFLSDSLPTPVHGWQQALGAFTAGDTTAEYPVTQRFITSQYAPATRVRPEPLVHNYSQWQLLTLGVALLIISLLRLMQKNFFTNIGRSLTSRPLFRQLYRDGDLFTPGSNILLFIASLLVYTTFVFQWDEVYHFLGFLYPRALYQQIAAVAIAIAIIILIKGWLMRLIGFIFKNNYLVREYLANTTFMNQVATIFLIPFLLFSLYSTSRMPLLAASIVALVIYLFRLFRSVPIGFESRKYSHHQNFIYLCALEILPVIIVLKIITG
ncbi:MAG TPA: DUF4271 domain-containing protein [Bacteroidales bacterium]|nr:DUF4271 domain-containing protein [Bacteroidales bacterium]